MNCESARKYAYLSAEITSLYHEAAVKIGVSDTVLDILYVLCEQEGQCLQSDIFRLTGISRQTINSAIRKVERDQKVRPLFQIENKIWSEWTVDEQERYLLFTQKYRDSFKKYLHEDL